MQYVFIWNSSLLCKRFRSGMPFVSYFVIQYDSYSMSHTSRYSIFSRFDGTTNHIQNGLKTEATSNHRHAQVFALGVFEGKPFVTGSCAEYNPGPPTGPRHKKTEILNYVESKWEVQADYPFNTGIS